MEMQKTEQFLELYRTYEGLLRDNGIDYKMVEDEADDLTQNRMRICRQIRNYLSHQNDPGFLEISDTQIRYLTQLVETQKMAGDVLANHLSTVRAGTCALGDTCVEVIRKMKRLKTTVLPVYDRMAGVIGMIHLMDVAMAAAEQKTLVADVKMKTDVICAKPESRMEDIIASNSIMVCCTVTGLPKGKLSGVYFKPDVLKS